VYPKGTIRFRRWHFLGVSILLNLLMDSSKKTANGSGVGVKNREKFADVLNGWSQIPVWPVRLNLLHNFELIGDILT
jgi:hypothetical protein